MIQELRRGSEKVVLFSVSFHFENDWLACISDSGTLHIFNLLKKNQSTMSAGRRESQTLRESRKSVKKQAGSSKNPRSMYSNFLLN